MPDVRIAGYTWLRIPLDARELGSRQRRLRHFQWGSREGLVPIVTREEIAARFPDAAAWCTQLREHFGVDARLVYARNGAGEEIGRRVASPLTFLASILVTIKLESERALERDVWIARCRADRRARLAPISSPGAPAP